jgi:hypothetical protein
LCEGRFELTRTLASAAVAAFDSQDFPLGSAIAQITLGKVDLEEARYQEATARFLRGLEVALAYGSRTLLAHSLEGFSGLASAQGQHQRALRLGAAAEALHESDGTPLHLAQRRVVERWWTFSREALGVEAATTAWAAGRILSVERALEEAKLGAGAKTFVPLPRPERRFPTAEYTA